MNPTNKKYIELMEKYIDETLLGVIFSDKSPNVANNEYITMRTVLRVLRFTGVLFHVLWIQSKAYPELFVSSEFNDCFTNFWEGGYRFDEKFPMTILYYAKQSINEKYQRCLIRNSKVFDLWSSVINKYIGLEYKEFINEDIDFFSMFEELLMCLPIIKNSALNEKKGTISIKIDNNMQITTEIYPLMKKYDVGYTTYLYLYRYEKTESNFALSYANIDGKVLDVQEINKKEYFDFYNLWMIILGKEKSNDPVFANNLSCGSFKMINRLAYCFSTINSQTTKRMKLQESFFEKHLSLLQDMNCQNQSAINKYVAILLNKGPSYVIREILDKQYLDYQDYLEKLCKNQNVEDYEHYITKETKKQQNIISRFFKEQSEEKNRLIDQSEKEVICSALLLAAGENEVHISYFNETIIYKIKRMDEIYNSSSSINDKITKAATIIERTLKFLIVFYNMLIKYAQEYYRNDEEDINTIIERCNSAAEVEAQKAFKEIHGKMLGSLVKDFAVLAIELNEMPLSKLTEKSKVIEKFCKDAEIKDVGNFHNKCVSSFLERHSLCDIEKLIEYLSKMSYVKGNLRNAVAHDMSDKLIELTNGSAQEYVNNCRNFLRYLRFNSDMFAEMDSDKYISYDPIYPIVVSFESFYRNKDGIILTEYKIKSDDKKIKHVKMVSKYEYATHQDYYCIPNKNKIFGDWWVEPFLFKCENIDNIIYRLEKE